MSNNNENYSVEQLEKMLADKKAAETAKRKAEREEYETNRDNFIKRVIAEAVAYSDMMREFKEDLHQAFDDHAEKLSEYGGIRTNSKGGFSLTTSDGKLRVKRRRNTTPQWDERSKKGEELIIKFLEEKIEDKSVHKLVMSFLERNEAGELEYSQVMKLINMRNDFDDERWLRGLDLVQESYSLIQKAYGYEMYRKAANGKWDKIEINFTSI